MDNQSYIRETVNLSFYPFGMRMPDRILVVAEESYRYGFNSREKDDEVRGDGGALEFGSRSIYDPRIGKFISVDPDVNRYAFLSPYVFAADNPILFIDNEGKGPSLEWMLEFANAYYNHLNETLESVMTEEEVTEFKNRAMTLNPGLCLNGACSYDPLFMFSMYEDLETTVKQLYEEGLLDPDVIIGTIDEFVQKLIDGDPEAWGVLAAEVTIIAVSELLTEGEATAYNLDRIAYKIGDDAARVITREFGRISKLPSALKRRPKLWKETREAIYRKTEIRMDANGNLRFVDPDGNLIMGDNVTKISDGNGGYIEVKGDFHFAHKKGHSWRRYQDENKDKNKSRKDVIKDQNDPDLYFIDDGLKNSKRGGNNSDY